MRISPHRQLRGKLPPLTAKSVDLYHEAIELEASLLRMFRLHLRAEIAHRIPQDLSDQTWCNEPDWSSPPEGVVRQARTYTYE